MTRNILSPAALAHLYAIDPISARALEAAGDLTPRRPHRAPRKVIDNRALLAIIMRDVYGRPDEPAGEEEEDVIEGEWTDVD